MASQTISQVADAVLADLQTGITASAFSQTFTPTRDYLPLFDLKDLKTLRVTVLCESRTQQLADRRRRQREYRIDVGVEQKVSQATAKAEIDALVAFVEEIADYFDFSRLSADPDIICVGAQIDPIFDAQDLWQNSVFASAVQLTLRVVDE